MFPHSLDSITMAGIDPKQLKQLKKELKKQRQAQKKETQERIQQEIQESQDLNLFLNAMEGVSPLQHDKAHHEPAKPKAIKQTVPEEPLVIHDPLSDELDIEEVNSTDILSYCQTGIQKSVFRKLKSGTYRISDELDLHGTSLKQAKKILVYYLQEAVQFEGCCIRIIHGKGNRSGNNKPVLKTHINHWLTEHDRVLAFHSAKPKDGGTGALYVLLKRHY